VQEKDITRRTFLKIAGVAAAATGGPREILAILEDGSIIVQDHHVPAEKGLSEAWKKSLFERGVKEVWSGAELESIGMPCGGIASGQLYLCGDGTLGNWEIFNTHEFLSYGLTNYAKRAVKKQVRHGFTLIVGDVARSLDKNGFKDVTFNGQYPVATVGYSDESAPVSVAMRAYSPFIPLNAKDSSLPATVFEFEVKNTTGGEVRFRLTYEMENPVGRSSEESPGARMRFTEAMSGDGLAGFVHGADPAPEEFGPDVASPRASVLVADFEGDDYGGWVATGDSFGTAPSRGTLVNQNRVSGFVGRGLVNTYLGGDETTGTLTSPEFRIERRFINFKIGGGNHPGQECLNLVIDGKVVRTATGMNDERLLWETWDVREFEGRTARLVIVDTATGGWGHINLDHVEMADTVRDRAEVNLRRGDPNRDVGTLAFAFFVRGEFDGVGRYGFKEPRAFTLQTAELALAPGEARTVVGVLAWHFPNHARGRQYANWFPDAKEVVYYVHANFKRLSRDTAKWVDTYYNSTLPYWLLDRLGSTVGNLATGTTEWWGNGRFWAWEGVVCCAGTCTHVWNYEHAMARLFPELERNVRERQDFGEGFHEETGLVGFRSDSAYAADGQCGTVLKAYREHTMSADDEFLKKNWPRIKKAMQFSISHDPDKDGVIADSQHNTYDINFEGPNTFVGALYLAALRAAEEMAKEVGDGAFATECRGMFERGGKATMEALWDGEYFIQKVDAAQHPQWQYGPGCLADQLFGQGWAHHVGLGHVYPKENVVQALRSVWKYCWAPDIAPHNARWKPERPFAVPGEAGLFICTWPKGARPNQPVRYRDEVWTGIEYQVAGHMVWEGMVEEGLAMCRAVHDRYHPAKRNPYNEVECSDHYARALSSWGVYTALAGFGYHGPRGEVSLDPRITPADFKAAFTAAEGWGLAAQVYDEDGQITGVSVRHGKLRVNTFSLRPIAGTKPKYISVSVPRGDVSARVGEKNGLLAVFFDPPITLSEGENVAVRLIAGRSAEAGWKDLGEIPSGALDRE
jgi:uncharacterized protein (DUF608 family)